MSSSRATAMSVAASVVGVCATYVLAKRLGLPMLWLDPEAMAWSFGSRPTALAMDFFGRGGLSLLVGAACFAVVRVLRPSLLVRPTVVRVGAALVALAVAGCLSWEAARLVGQLPHPQSVAERARAQFTPGTGQP